MRGTPVVVRLGVHDPDADQSTRTTLAMTGVRAQHAEVSAQTVEAIARILARGQAVGDTIAEHYRRKEHELGAVFATLSIAESRALHRRLAIAATGDELAAAFLRLTADRRVRLLAFLADVRRRAAV